MKPDWFDRIPWGAVHNYAEDAGLDAQLIAAFIMTESSGNPDATRFEPHWAYFYSPELYTDDEHNLAEERTQQATSWGLMQVMGSVARELKYRGDLESLVIPELSVKYGCLLLTRLKLRYPDQNDMIAAYNAGSPRRLPNGQYCNQAYVDHVLGYMNALK